MPGLAGSVLIDVEAFREAPTGPERAPRLPLVPGRASWRGIKAGPGPGLTLDSVAGRGSITVGASLTACPTPTRQRPLCPPGTMAPGRGRDLSLPFNADQHHPFNT